MSTWVYIIKRIASSIPILFIVSLISFFLIRLSPVDPLAQLRLNPAISQETINSEVKRLGLDKPIGVQYLLWAKNFIKDNMGYCTDNTKVSTKLKGRILNTLLLSICVIFFSWIIAIPLGVLAAVYYNSWFDKMLTVLSSIGMAIPSFFFAILSVSAKATCEKDNTHKKNTNKNFTMILFKTTKNLYIKTFISQAIIIEKHYFHIRNTPS